MGRCLAGRNDRCSQARRRGHDPALLQLDSLRDLSRPVHSLGLLRRNRYLARMSTDPSRTIPSSPPRGVMFQYFEWNNRPDGSLWRELASLARELRNLGTTAVWMPPAYKSMDGPTGTGYA